MNRATVDATVMQRLGASRSNRWGQDGLTCGCRLPFWWVHSAPPSRSLEESKEQTRQQRTSDDQTENHARIRGRSEQGPQRDGWPALRGELRSG